MKRQTCPQCGHTHTGYKISRRDILDIQNCPLYRLNRSVEQENKIFRAYSRHINQEIDRWKEERHFA